MKQTIRTSKVYKCPKIRHILDNTFYYVSFMDTLKQRFLEFCLFRDQKLFPVADNSSSPRIKLCDYKFDLLIRIFSEILFICVGYQTRRDENSCFIYNNTKSSFQNLCHFRGQHFLIFKSLLKPLAASLCSDSSVRQLNLSLSIIHFQNLHFHRITRGNHSCQVRIWYIRILISGYNTIGLISNI